MKIVKKLIAFSSAILIVSSLQAQKRKKNGAKDETVNKETKGKSNIKSYGEIIKWLRS